MEKGWKNGRFQRKTGHISETAKRLRLLLITNRKWHTPLRLYENRRPWMTLKVTDNQYGRLS